MKTINKLVVGAMVALAFTSFNSCSGTGTGTGDPTPLVVSTPEVSEILQTRVKVTASVVGDNLGIVKCICDSVPGGKPWHDEIPAATADEAGVVYSCIMDKLEPDTAYTFAVRAFDIDGKYVEKSTNTPVATLPKDKPVDHDWEWVQSTMAKTLQRVGHDDEAPFVISITEDTFRTWCSTHKILRGIPIAGELCFDPHTLSAISASDDSHVEVQFAYCDPSQEASLNADAVKAAKDFNVLHGDCPEGVLARAHVDFVDLLFADDYTLTP